MANNIGNKTLVCDITPTAGPASDFRGNQFKAVQFAKVNVVLADESSLASAIYLLGNKPNSGEAAQFVGPPNILTGIAGTSINAGDYVTVMSATGLLKGGTQANGFACAFTTAAGSGEFIQVQVRK